MERFTTRVELINSDDYETLHEQMEAEGFTRTIFDTKTGEEYHLPPAEYNYIDDLTREQVLAKAKSAASLTGAEFRILVTPSPGRVWYNLLPVENG